MSKQKLYVVEGVLEAGRKREQGIRQENIALAPYYHYLCEYHTEEKIKEQYDVIISDKARTRLDGFNKR